MRSAWSETDAESGMRKKLHATRRLFDKPNQWGCLAPRVVSPRLQRNSGEPFVTANNWIALIGEKQARFLQSSTRGFFMFFFRNRRRKTENAAFSLCLVSISGKEGPCKRVNKSVTEIVAGWIKCRVHSESWKTIEAEMISFELVANYSAAWATCCVPLGMNSISHYDKEIPRKFSVMFVFPKENSNQ